MSGIREGTRDSLGRVGYDLLSRALADCGREWFTGELRVAGSPGGTFHLRNGLVVCVESPGAPGPGALLLRSGRVSGEQWAELVRESGGSRWPAGGLIAHGYAGAAQLRVVCVMALQDAAFAVVAGRVDGCEPLDGAEPPAAPVAAGEASARLLQEATRKLAALAALPYPVRPDRERPVPALVSRAGARLTALQRELLTHADGRRTARDLAFRTGRGVYTVTVELARMLGEGLLECADAPVPIPVRLPPDCPGVRPREAQPPPEPPPRPLSLPRRKSHREMNPMSPHMKKKNKCDRN
ncbi:MarR family transcriptional regulator [Streptomyces sp. NPDC002928]|uniref:MarR family transcriptional regulator n=1 Tax=Streptomyces sp. NPDC002928 TaxID=3154440 RepID=UPI0033B9CE60